MREIVRFKKVSLRYKSGQEVLKDVSFSLQPQSFYFLTGNSGAGKSSLLKLLYVGHRGYRGSIELFGQDVINIQHKDIPALRKNIGIVFQDFLLFDHLTVIDNVALARRIQGFSWNESRKKAKDLLDWIGLANHFNHYPPELSGGQKQRTVIARAVINRPKLLLADEPTGNLDDENALKLMCLFEELNRMGTTVLVATHAPQLSRFFSHPILHLDQGTLRIVNHTDQEKHTHV